MISAASALIRKNRSASSAGFLGPIDGAFSNFDEGQTAVREWFGHPSVMFPLEVLRSTNTQAELRGAVHKGAHNATDASLARYLEDRSRRKTSTWISASPLSDMQIIQAPDHRWYGAFPHLQEDSPEGGQILRKP